MSAEPPVQAGEPAPDHQVPHVYRSTACLHGQHDYCASMTGAQGAKRPATCKFCAARCVCPCHARLTADTTNARARLDGLIAELDRLKAQRATTTNPGDQTDGTTQ